MATWPVNPTSVKEEEITFKANVVEFLSGLEVRSLFRSTPRRKWTCYFDQRYEDQIRDHFLAHYGNYEKFQFTHPETSITYWVRYEMESFNRKKFVKDTYTVEVSIVEVAS